MPTESMLHAPVGCQLERYPQGMRTFYYLPQGKTSTATVGLLHLLFSRHMLCSGGGGKGDR